MLSGNPGDQKQLRPSLAAHQAQFAQPPQQVSADRGVHSTANEQAAKDQGVKRVVLPKPGKKSLQRQQFEKQRWFRRGRKWHAGVEGRISVLKRVFGLDRCLNRGEQGSHRWVGWGMIASNLRAIGIQWPVQVAKSG